MEKKAKDFKDVVAEVSQHKADVSHASHFAAFQGEPGRGMETLLGPAHT